MKKILYFILLLCLSFITQAQVYSIAQEAICWTTPTSVDSSLNRYVLLSNLDNQPPRVLRHVNGSGDVVDVSGGGTFKAGYCGTIIASMIIDEIDVVQDSIIVLLAGGVEITRDTVGPFGGTGGDGANGMFDIANQDSIWEVTRYYLPLQHFGYIREKGGFILKDSSISRYANETLLEIYASSGTDNPPIIRLGSGNYIPQIQLLGDTLTGGGRIVFGLGGETYDLPIKDPDGNGLPPGEYLPLVTELGARAGTGGWIHRDSLVDTNQIATQNYVRTYHQDELTLYLANDTLANPVVFTVDTIKAINVLSYQSVPTGVPSTANITVAPVGRYMFHLRNTDAQTVDFPSTFKLANGDFADDGSEHFLFQDQMWDCYSDGLVYHCNTPNASGIYDPFLFTINTANPGVSDDSTFVMPFAVGSVNDFEVDWGDGTIETITNDTVTHTYASPGIYDISVKGQIGKWAFNNVGDKSKMLDVIEWGDFVLSQSAFMGCDSMTVSATDTPRATGNLNRAFAKCSSITTMNLIGISMSGALSTSSMFSECISLTSLDLSEVNTSRVEDMSFMFNGCTSLTSLDVSSFNTNSLKNAKFMFNNCSDLTSLDVSGFNTSNVTNMERMFSGCTSLTSLDVSSFNTNSLNNANFMFNNCSDLTSLDVSGFNTSNVTNMAFMFSGCSSLDSLNLSNFNTTNATTLAFMFSGCSSLTDLDVSSFNTSLVTTFSGMFNICSSLDSLNVSNFNTSSAINMSNMFSSMTTSTDITGIENLTISSITNITNFLTGTTLPVSRYNSLLINYEAQTPPTGLSFHGGNSTYTLGGAAETARTSLTTTYTWTITDGGGI